jgi:hypothetical protein
MGCLRVRCLGWLSKPRLAWVLSTVALVTLGLVQPFVGNSFAQDAMSSPAPEDDAPLDISRDQWRERVAEAKRRARQFAVEHRGRSTPETACSVWLFRRLARLRRFRVLARRLSK